MSTPRPPQPPQATTGTNTAKRTTTTTSTTTGTSTVTDPPPLPALPAAALLQLIWLASPALPVGGFSYSEVLEPAVEAGLVASEAQASRWLGDQLQLVIARSELPVVAQSFAAWQHGDLAAVAALNAWVTTTRESSELRQQTEQMGRSLVEWLKNDDDATGGGSPDARIAALAALKPAPCWPVAFALAAVRTGAPQRESLLAFAFGWAENMVQAALKSVPLGQNAGQRILRALAADIPAAVAHALSLPYDERQAFAPMLAILSARHETQYSRLFRS